MVVGIDVNGLESAGRPSAIHPRVECAERIELRVEQPVAVREAGNAIEATKVSATACPNRVTSRW
jgi:hypothetical protein